MPVLPTYPGVYIEEPSSGVRTIASVATSIAAFVDRFKQGPMNKATQIFGMADFNRIFGGLDKDSEASYAISQFFLNGGSEAWVVRVSTNEPAETEKAQYTVSTGDDANQKKFLTLTAKSPGPWGKNLRVTILPSSKNGEDFDLTITHYADDEGTKPIASESFASLSVKKDKPRYCTKIVNPESKLVDVTVESEVAPQCTATVIALAEPPTGLGSPDFNRISVTIGDESRTIQVGPTRNGTLQEVRRNLESVIRSSKRDGQDKPSTDKRWTDATVALTDGVLIITAGTPDLPANDGQQDKSPPPPVRVSGPYGKETFALKTLGFTTSDKDGTRSAKLTENESGNPSAQVRWLLTPAFSLTLDEKPLALSLDAIAKSKNPKAELGAALQQEIRKLDVSNPRYSQATVELRGNNLVIRAGGKMEKLDLQFANAEQGGQIPGDLRWAFSSISNGPQYYALTQPAASSNGNESQSQGAGLSAGLLGDEAQKTGIYALRDADMFNLLCLPAVTKLEQAQSLAVLQAALNLCKERRAFLIVDVPDDVKSVQDAKDFHDKYSLSDKANAAVYFPRLKIPDPLDGYRPRSVGASGTMAGLYARTDVARGVWKAPAGTEATLAGVVELTTKLTDRENGALNPLGINCARSLPIYGHVCWGARTLDGADETGSEWKYIPVRRLALFIEESLFRGTKWVVFEPNDEPLWAKVRLNVRAFMLSLFQQGAFQGTSETKAFYVRCDATTTTQDDRNRGIINIEVGFAPLKPAEFVIIKVQQIAGDLG